MSAELLKALRLIASDEPQYSRETHGPGYRCACCGYRWDLGFNEPERHSERCAYSIAKKALAAYDATTAEQAVSDARDAVRYRWLRKHSGIEWDNCGYLELQCMLWGDNADISLDEAIDNAINKPAQADEGRVK